MREIKFRAWDKTLNEMYSDGDNGTHFDYRNIPQDWVLMQFTGLKDKNGKEIYEGDIVRGVGEHKGQSPVFYDSGRYQPFSYLGTYMGDEFEVIGNIHEHPELLKSEKKGGF